MGRSDASLFAGAVVGVGALFWLYQRHVSSTEPEEPLAKEAVPCRTPALALAPPGPDTDYTSIKIVYGTVTGTARLFALELADQLRKRTADKVEVLDMADYNPERLEKESRLIVLCSTWTDGGAPDRVAHFFDWVQYEAYDFRVGNDALKKLSFAVFGLGGALYMENFAKCTAELHDSLQNKLGATALVPYSRGDDQTDLQDRFRVWSQRVLAALTGGHDGDGVADDDDETSSVMSSSTVATSMSMASTVNGVKRPPRKEYQRQQRAVKKAAEAEANGGSLLEEEDRINATFVDYEGDSDEEDAADKAAKAKAALAVGTDEEMVDMEDLGSVIKAGQEGAGKKGLEMVTTLQRQALTKEGYKIIGTHSAVKLCRWTKHQLRGRGGCYKHTFYGITSYQCMEATPSLACASKCVFCWRHHKNPVGTEWRWKQDSPEFIVREAIKLHQNLINQMRGVPGVQPERLKEAFTVAHCALSLVGEPIMYPQINTMLRELHNRHISTFMVTNAQFPTEIAALDPVTQLYVSVDASTKESLKAIDRPLFKDFWERFHGSLKSLADKQQRTVYRLTLVNGWNMNEAEEYAKLIEEHQPDFIEIKAVTYCGKSDGSNLTMENVPWHKEVCAYCEAIAGLVEKIGMEKALKSETKTALASRVRYSIATEHEHSCCVLLAREDKFLVKGIWHTWIDYPKYHTLIQDYYASNGEKTFVCTDYMLPTPHWALYQAPERGFDPVENRWRRNKAGALVEREYKSSESGCG